MSTNSKILYSFCTLAVILLNVFILSGCGNNNTSIHNNITSSATSSDNEVGTVKNGTVQVAPPKFDNPNNNTERKSADFKN